MPCTFHARYVFTLVGFISFTIQYMLRTSLSISIVAMTTPPSIDVNLTTNDCFTDSNNSSHYEEIVPGEFDWDEKLQGIILSAFFWGYISPMVLSGWLADRYGGKILYTGGIAVDGIVSLFIPLAARTHVALLIILRVVQGLAEGMMIPSFHSMLGKWSLPNERSRMSSFSYAGQSFGIVLALPFAGLMCQYGFDGGWPAAFYTLGIAGIFSAVMCYFFLFDSPSIHPRISDEEKIYIQTAIGATERKTKFLPIPWKQILKSPPVWALSITGFGYSWGHYMFLTQLPNYMKNILRFNIKTNGFLSAVPYLLYIFVSSGCGATGDLLIRKKIFSVTATRKIFQTIATGGPALCLLAVTLSGCNVSLILTWLILAGGCLGAVFTAVGINHVDLSPNFSGVLQGVTLTIGNLAGILVPYIIGVIIQGKQTRSQWNLAYYTSSTILILSTFLYLFFGSGELQSWNEPAVAEIKKMAENGEKTCKEKKRNGNKLPTQV